jgi:hypothetical protein
MQGVRLFTIVPGVPLRQELMQFVGKLPLQLSLEFRIHDGGRRSKAINLLPKIPDLVL